jgi:hypothetical protein
MCLLWILYYEEKEITVCSILSSENLNQRSTSIFRNFLPSIESSLKLKEKVETFIKLQTELRYMSECLSLFFLPFQFTYYARYSSNKEPPRNVFNTGNSVTNFRTRLPETLWNFNCQETKRFFVSSREHSTVLF